MSVFFHKEFDQHEQVIFCHDPVSGLKAIIALHSTTGGPALGGCRMWPYGSDDEALTDVLRLSRGMTYKSAISLVPQGGGKSVIIGHSDKDKTEDLLRAMGRFVHSLGGRYIIAEDVGTNAADMAVMKQVTPYVTGVSGQEGDPSPATAYGVFLGTQAAVKHRLQKDSLKGLKVAVQGIGHVGMVLCDMLHKAGAQLYVSDIHDKALLKAKDLYNATIVEPPLTHTLDVDIFAPCALGGILNDETIPYIKASIVAGSANNQLLEQRHAQDMKDRNILYAPDYVINAGGLIYVVEMRQGMNSDQAYHEAERITDTLEKVFTMAEQEKINTAEAADMLAKQRLQERRQTQQQPQLVVA